MEWILKMWNKKVELLQSRRFWMLTLTAALAIIKLDPATLPEVLTIVQTWLVAVVAIGTVDKWPRAMQK